MIKVVVVGAKGRMGSEVVKAVAAASDMELVGACDIVGVGEELPEAPGIFVERDLQAVLTRCKPNVMVDFAKPYNLDFTRLAMEHGVVPIIGTTGQTQEQLAEIEQLTELTGTAAMVIPNFAIGAVLMMKFAAQAAVYMPDVEIIELHHEKKVDAPSGTSIMTAQMIDAARKAADVKAVVPAGSPDDRARGDEKCGVRIHSVRLPGLVAHQEVIFGGLGQVLSIRHDSLDRTSFMPGVLLAIRRASQAKGLTYGLDKLL
ncbi:MAG: 4-hydroxy-tetrahydrodipicolinate reductase [Armatimonadota bacterium]|nr:4-hydroxy-tetrahydrodipicolinate reductase [Armatimonadota bacterium]